MDFLTLRSLVIPEGIVTKIISSDVTLWEKPSSYTDLVPTALATDGTILNGAGYQPGYYWENAALTTASAFTAIGMIEIDGTFSRNIYLYGLDLTGTSRNRFILYNQNFGVLAQTASIKEGFSNTYIASIEKLANYYWKITTNVYSTKVKYFTLSGVTVSGMKPIVTLDEEIL